MAVGTPTRTIHVLNLGAGVQSTTLYLMVLRKWADFHLDYAVFADTGEEPQAVYDHLEWLKTLNGPPIITGSRGRLGEDLKFGTNSTGHRFAAIPAFTAPDGATYKTGIMRRQCTQEYKIRPIEQAIRREICGLPPGRAVPKSIQIFQYYGISTDERQRATRIAASLNKSTNWHLRFPLIDEDMTRADCQAWLRDYGMVPHVVPRSACVFCPYHTDAEWINIKTNDPVAWARAVEIDEALRVPGHLVNRGLDQKLYLHQKVRPLVQIEFNAASVADFGVDTQECEGMCGN